MGCYLYKWMGGRWRLKGEGGRMGRRESALCGGEFGSTSGLLACRNRRRVPPVQYSKNACVTPKRDSHRSRRFATLGWASGMPMELRASSSATMLARSNPACKQQELADVSRSPIATDPIATSVSRHESALGTGDRQHSTPLGPTTHVPFYDYSFLQPPLAQPGPRCYAPIWRG